MDFGLNEKHKAFIKERWLPLSVEFMLQEGFIHILSGHHLLR